MFPAWAPSPYILFLEYCEMEAIVDALSENRI